MNSRAGFLALIIFSSIFPIAGQAPAAVGDVTYDRANDPNQQPRRRDPNQTVEKRIIDSANQRMRNAARAVPTANHPYFILHRDWVEDPLKVSRETKEKYRSFLKGDDTGIFQLVPLEKCSSGGGDERSETPGFISPESAYYSFSLKVHYKPAADLFLSAGRFEAELGMRSAGYIVPLGTTEIDQIDSNTAEAAKLARIVPARLPHEIEAHRNTGINRVEARVGTTYLMRSVHFGFTDVIVAFTPVEKAENGNLIILWKLISKQKNQ